jgi:hypothetical protein
MLDMSYPSGSFVLTTSDPTLRAVFAEDAAALIGFIVAAGLAGHQLTGSSPGARCYRLDPV